MGMNMENPNKKKEKNQDYMNPAGENNPDLNLNQPLYKDTKHSGLNGLDDMNGKYGHDKYRNLYREDASPEQSTAHSPEKKR